jgi:hypothetical protein
VGKSHFYRQMITHIQAKASRNWTAYAVRDWVTFKGRILISVRVAWKKC